MADLENLWQKRIREFEDIGVPGTEFCRLHSLKYQTFRYWLKKLGSKKTTDPNEGVFVPIQVKDRKELVLKINGCEIFINDGFPPELLRSLIVTLRGC